MALAIGLDFGTHQTKICIQNSDDPHHVTYEFMKWGEREYVLPSIVQIDSDHRVRYGSCDLDTALYGKKKKTVKQPAPLVLPEEPHKPELDPEFVELPERLKEPVHRYTDINGVEQEIPYSELLGMEDPINEDWINPLDEWEYVCEWIDEAYENELKIYSRIGEESGMETPKKSEYPPKPRFVVTEDEEILDVNLFATAYQRLVYHDWKNEYRDWEVGKKEAEIQLKKEVKEYERQYKSWVETCQTLVSTHKTLVENYETSIQDFPMVFRYFKQATFSAYNWTYQLEAPDISILYLANIIFQLEEKFGQNFSIQMGVPASKNNFQRLKEKATKILIQAFRLVENVFENDYEEFLGTPYEELITLIPEPEYSDELKTQYGIMILPEAFASLRSLTARSRIPSGMSIMLDIGGGTTDISFFTLEKDGSPHIYHFYSMTKGLNFFLEFNEKVVDFSLKREIENLPEETFKGAYQEFERNLKHILNDLIGYLHKDTINRGFAKSTFIRALQNRPVIYTGGGSYVRRLRKGLSYFRDVVHLNKDNLGAENVLDENSINLPFSILSTAYGLSHAVVDDNIIISSKEDLFANLFYYDDRRWDRHSEHGLLDN